MKKLSLAEENAAMERAKQQRAVDALAEMLCGGADPQPDAEPAEVIRVDAETGTMQPLRMEVMADTRSEEPAPNQAAWFSDPPDLDAKSEEETATKRVFAYARVATERQMMPKADLERRSLQLHNAAISALDALLQDGIENDFITEQVEIMLDRLRELRMNTFEHLVPWEQLAGGEAR